MQGNPLKNGTKIEKRGWSYEIGVAGSTSRLIEAASVKLGLKGH